MTDVVESTALWEAFPESMPAALELHDAVVHGAVEAAGGSVFKHTGDGMIAAFGGADAAVDASLSLVDGLAGLDWGPTGALAVRVSIHAGDATERDRDFFGQPVNRVARMIGVGHPGQVLMSDVARQLMREPSGEYLGEVELRGIPELIRLWQLDRGGHAPLRGMSAARNNLPRLTTDLVGRHDETAELTRLLADHRLVTITGVGGCGKTRLGIEVAGAVSFSFPGGVWFVDLTTEREGDHVADRVISALGMARPVDGTAVEPVEFLVEITNNTPTLLVIDNCEHLIDDVADFTQACLSGSERISVLATSREALSVAGERVWRIPSLRGAAVELFVERATAAGATGWEERLELVEQICHQLDDIPLAIELAAAQLGSLSLEDLAARLDDRFAILSGGPRAGRRRQQTLQAMMDWSYGLLSSGERQLFDELSVFVGSFGVEGAESVATPAAATTLARLQSLVAQSMVAKLAEAGRYRLLETARLYALSKLDSRGEIADARDRHLQWALDVGGLSRQVGVSPDDFRHYDARRRAERTNIVAAIEWADDRGDTGSVADLLYGSHIELNQHVPHLCRAWLAQVPKPSSSDKRLLVAHLVLEGWTAYGVGDLDTAYALYTVAASIVDDFTDADHLAVPEVAAGALIMRANFVGITGNVAEELELAARMAELAERMPVLVDIEWSQRQLTADAYGRNNDPRAVPAMEASLEAAPHVGVTTTDVARYMASTTFAMFGHWAKAVENATLVLEHCALTQFRIRQILPLGAGLARLGRLTEAVEAVQRDLGPMSNEQRRMLLSGRLLALAFILDQLNERSLVPDLVNSGLALASMAGRVKDRFIVGQLFDGGIDDLPTSDRTTIDLHASEQLFRSALQAARS